MSPTGADERVCGADPLLMPQQRAQRCQRPVLLRAGTSKASKLGVERKARSLLALNAQFTCFTSTSLLALLAPARRSTSTQFTSAQRPVYLFY
jgi:hypothetical protein